MKINQKEEGKNKSLIGIAGVHYVVSELSRRGIIALPTVKNTAAYDIIAMNIEGTKHANIQVKTSSKRAGFFLMPQANKIRTGQCDRYVLVRWIEKEQKYECFLLTGKQAKDAVDLSEEHQFLSIKRGTRKKHNPCVHVNGKDEKRAMLWRKAWQDWKL